MDGLTADGKYSILPLARRVFIVTSGDIAYEFKLRDGSWFGTGQALMYEFNGRPSDASSILTPEIIDLMNSYLN